MHSNPLCMCISATLLDWSAKEQESCGNHGNHILHWIRTKSVVGLLGSQIPLLPFFLVFFLRFCLFVTSFAQWYGRWPPLPPPKLHLCMLFALLRSNDQQRTTHKNNSADGLDMLRSEFRNETRAEFLNEIRNKRLPDYRPFSPIFVVNFLSMHERLRMR